MRIYTNSDIHIDAAELGIQMLTLNTTPVDATISDLPSRWNAMAHVFEAHPESTIRFGTNMPMDKDSDNIPSQLFFRSPALALPMEISGSIV